MTQSLHPSAEKGFSQAANLYQQVRPDYPKAIQTWLRQTLELRHHQHVLDLGSGTGKFLPYLNAVSEHVYAVEPIDEMRHELKQRYPTVQAIKAFSHALPFQDQQFDAILCAQAFHWFATTETLHEMYRVLKPNGHLGLVWNQRNVAVNWVNQIAEVLRPLEGDTPRYHHDTWKQVFEQQDLFEFIGMDIFEHEHYGKVEDVVSKRLLSTSFIAAMPPEQQQQLKSQFEHIVFDATGQAPQDYIAFPYQTYAYHFKKLQA